MTDLLICLAFNRSLDAQSGLSASDKIQILIALATFFAVIVALFQEKIKEYFRRAHLDVTIDTNPPDSHKIKLTNENGIPIQDVIYIRIRVQHVKGDPAKSVEVMLVNCWEYKGENKSLKKNFLPLNLVWSHFQPRLHSKRIPAGLFRHCDLGYLYKYGQNTRFRFDTIVQPNGVGDEGDLPNVLGKGKYEIELWISGDNTKTLKKKWLIKIDGKWDDSEATMLEKHIIIEEL